METQGSDLRHKSSVKTFKLLVLLVLAGGIFGPAAYFGYELFIKPSRIEKSEKAAPTPSPTPAPTPETGAADLQQIKSRMDSGTPASNRDAITAWISAHPSSPLLGEARGILGSLNITLLLHPVEANSGASYTVQKGDSLAKIAAKFHSNAELIQKANALPGIGLQIGQTLVIPAPQVTLELDRKARTLTLLDKGTFVKEYALLNAPAAPKNSSVSNTKVLDKVATYSGKRIAFGDKNYPKSERLILLGQAPSISSWTPAPTPVPGPQDSKPTPTNSVPLPAPSPMPGGYVLSVDDLLELFPLVSRNTPVTIR
jgi:LysM repeat protein